MVDRPRNNVIPLVKQSREAITIANHVAPITDFQADYSSYRSLNPINYHAHVHEQDSTREDKYAWLLLLNVGLPDGTEYRPYKIERSSKKPRLQEPKPRMYRRLYTFANLISPGGTCVLFENNLDDQMSYLKYLEKCRIGDQFALIEPNPDTSFVGNEMPIINTSFNLIPSRLDDAHLLPEVPIPSQVAQLNSSKFFVLHNATLTFDGVHLVKSMCTQGNLCDLREPKKGDCPCWYQRNRNRTDAEYTLRGDIRVDYTVRNTQIHRQARLPKIQAWSSQHFTEFVFDGALPLNPMQHESDMEMTRFIRRKLRDLVNFVNSTDTLPLHARGWTIIGWYRRGAKTDAPAGAHSDDKVATEMGEATMHIVRVQPTHIKKQTLEAANLLLPTALLGETTNIDHIRQLNTDANPPES